MKTIAFLVVFFLPLLATAQEQEMIAITKTINMYFEGMMERNKEKLDQAFHPEAKLIGYRGETLFVTPYLEWAQSTSQGEPRDPKLFSNTIKGIRIIGTMALAETDLVWPGIRYYDFLTLLKVGDEWKIVHKSWNETPLEK